MTDDGQVETLTGGGSTGEFTVEVPDAVLIDSNGDRYDFVADNAPVRSTYSITQVMSAKLYREAGQLESLQQALIRHHVEQASLTVTGDPLFAYSFGQLVHADDCTRAFVVDDDGTPVAVEECGEGCAIMPCGESVADVVLMRIQLDVEAAGERCDAESPSGSRCELPKGHDHA